MKTFITLCFLSSGLLMQHSAHAHQNGPSYGRPATSTRAQNYCTEARFQSYIDLAGAMRDFVSPVEYAEAYIPLKVAAAKALIALRTNGPLSQTTHNALFKIVKLVNSNEAKFNALWEIEAFFPVAQDLAEMTSSLERDLQ